MAKKKKKVDKEEQDVSVRDIPADLLSGIDEATEHLRKTVPNASRNTVMKLLLTAAVEMLKKGELVAYPFNDPRSGRKTVLAPEVS